MLDLFVGNFRIDLSGPNVRVTEHTGNALNGHTLAQRQRGKGMAGTMHNLSKSNGK